MDVLTVSVTRACPDEYQPENWELANDRVRRVRRLSDKEQLIVLLAGLSKGPVLFGSTQDKTSADTFQAKGATSSLVVVEPDQLEWHVERRKRRQVRASFAVGGQRYDLTVTDPLWHAKFDSIAIGSTLPRTFGGVASRDRIFLTLSMGAPYGGYCYKLIACVFRVRA